MTFPKLLEDPLVPEEDKRKIRGLLMKPWNPYVRRHTAATEISKSLKDSVLIDQYLGWSHAGNTRQKYQHYYADDSFNAMLAIDGRAVPSNNNNDGTANGRTKNLLKSKLCPNCNESNKPENKFCAKCKFVLSFDAVAEAIQEREKAAKEAEQARRDFEELKAHQQLQTGRIVKMMQFINKLEEREAKERAVREGHPDWYVQVNAWDDDECLGPIEVDPETMEPIKKK
ncbi:MAG: zinc ribbon domain-containing protein [Thermoproteota archaeon]|nr:zinc ribbon domain-containing protein [Thermoproteota archaeon]